MIKKYRLFTTPCCPNCVRVKEFLKKTKVSGQEIDASTDDGLMEASELKVASVPTVLFFNEKNEKVAEAHTIKEIEKVLK